MKIAKKKPYKNFIHMQDPKSLVSTKINCYTDGSCLHNGFGGPGTHAFIVIEDNKLLYEYGDRVESTTNNRQELQAVIECMKHLLQEHKGLMGTIHTDSSYVFNGCMTWIYGWASKNFMKDGKTIPNNDLWEQIWNLDLGKFQFVWVKGHDKNEWNNRADELCKEAYTESIRRDHRSVTWTTKNENKVVEYPVNILQPAVDTLTKDYEGTKRPVATEEEWEAEKKYREEVIKKLYGKPEELFGIQVQSTDLTEEQVEDIKKKLEERHQQPVEFIGLYSVEDQKLLDDNREWFKQATEEMVNEANSLQLQEVNNLLLDLYYTNYSHYARRIELYLIQHNLINK